MARAAVALALVLFAACASVPVNSRRRIEALASRPDSYLEGSVVGFGKTQVLNAEDFVYDARLSPDVGTLAAIRLGLKGFFATLYSLEWGAATASTRADSFVTTYENDVEMLEYTPDGSLLATVSRDGAVRLFDATTGAVKGAWLTDEPLVSLAIDPRGQVVVVGSAKGLLTVLSVPALAYLTELRGHSDEVRGLAFAPDGRLFSAGWDKRVITWQLGSAPSLVARVPGEQTAGPVRFRSILNHRASATVTIDGRFELVLVQAALAASAGIETSAASETATVVTAFGPQRVRVARGQTVSFKGLRFEKVDVGLCDACVPSGSQAVLGSQLLSRLEWSYDDATSEVVIEPKPGEAVMASQVSLGQRDVFELDAFVNDLSIDARGATLGLALSGVKAERNREVYQREKRGEAAPRDPLNRAAFVDAASGRIVDAHAAGAVVSTVGISPDGQSLAYGTWADAVTLLNRGQSGHVDEHRFGWSIRRARFSRNGRFLAIAAWTHQNPLGNHQSEPSAVVTEVVYAPE